MGASAIFGMFSGVYHWFPKMFGRLMDRRLGMWHFWLTFITVYCVFFPQHFIGLAGVPRRYYAFTEFDFAAGFVDLNKFITVAAIIGFTAQFIFLYNFVKSIFWGEKAGRNPWKANSLEWTVAEPGHGNWTGPIPTVYRGPHEYSKPGVALDYLPQHVSDEDLAKGVDYDNEQYVQAKA
jgi:cytochrome c oxidase subunit 1